MPALGRPHVALKDVPVSKHALFEIIPWSRTFAVYASSDLYTNTIELFISPVTLVCLSSGLSLHQSY